MAFKRTAPHSSHIASLPAILRGLTIVQPAEKKELAEAKKRYVALKTQLQAVGNDQAKKIITARRRAYDENPTAENLEVASKETVEELEVVHARTRTAVKRQIRSLTEELSPLAATIHARLLQAVNAALEKMKATEEKLSAEYGIPRTPGPITAALENLASNLQAPPMPIGAPFAFIERLVEI